MLESIKKRLWNLLKEKEVSFAMLYNKEGEILWHKGRKIIGRTIDDGQGFSKSYLKKVILNSNAIEERDVIVPVDQEAVIFSSKTNGLPKSAAIYNIKSLIIQPVSNNYFLYIDSGTKDYFTKTDRELFKMMGQILEDIIHQVNPQVSTLCRVDGNSPQMIEIRENILKYSIEEEPILLMGETGSGKTYIAEIIHFNSGRSGKFVTVNTPCIPENLFESELFGHKKGAFTDASSDKKGFVDEAADGTLFFDEISEVPLHFQSKLLRFIETKKYHTLGDSAEKEANVRIICATNQDLHQAISKQKFREDLFYRLQVLEIEIPPLRNRREDIKELVMAKIKFLKGKQPGKGFWETMCDHDWPGNIRELITVLIRAGIHCQSPITGLDIKGIIKQNIYWKYNDINQDINDKIWGQLKSGHSFWDVVKKPFLARDIKRKEVQLIIKRGLKESKGKYINLLDLFNIPKKDYHKFMSFLNDNKINC